MNETPDHGAAVAQARVRVVVGSDERTSATDAAIEHLRSRGFDVVAAGALDGKSADWVQAAEEVGASVAGGGAERAVLFCYTGTGASIAVNKIPNVRGALCVDAETARGARRWNDANVLVLSYRLATETLVREIIDAFLDTPADPAEAASFARLADLERRASVESAATGTTESVRATESAGPAA